MHCRNCGKEVDEKAIACPACGVSPRAEKKYCPNCGTATQPIQAMCTKCGVSLSGGKSAGGKEKTPAGLLAIFLGSLGVHKFYLGYNQEGLIMLLVSLLTCFLGGIVVGIIGLIEGIVYLTKSDEEFDQIYVQNKKRWF